MKKRIKYKLQIILITNLLMFSACQGLRDGYILFSATTHNCNLKISEIQKNINNSNNKIYTQFIDDSCPKSLAFYKNSSFASDPSEFFMISNSENIPCTIMVAVNFRYKHGFLSGGSSPCVDDKSSTCQEITKTAKMRAAEFLSLGTVDQKKIEADIFKVEKYFSTINEARNYCSQI